MLLFVLRVSVFYPPTGFVGSQVGEVYAPHALPMFREEQNSKKRKERSDRKDPVRSKKPDPPVSETRRQVVRFRLIPPLTKHYVRLVLSLLLGARTASSIEDVFWPRRHGV